MGGCSDAQQKAAYDFHIPEGEKFCPGKLTLGKILPGKNSVPELKNGGKNSVPLRVWKGKNEIPCEATKKFLAYILSMTR